MAQPARCCLLPCDLLGGQDAFLVIVAPKTSRVFRRQHVRVTGRGCVAVLDKVFGGMEPEQPLFELGATAFRKRWDCVFHRLGFGTAQRPLPTPACLRGSGATALYLASSDLPFIAWMGPLGSAGHPLHLHSGGGPGVLSARLPAA